MKPAQFTLSSATVSAMNPLRTIALLACLLAAVCATPSQQNNRGKSANNSLKPSEWLSASQLNAIPSVEDIKLQMFENMSLQEGAKLAEQIYHLSQINHDLTPSYVPSPNNIPVSILKQNGQKVTANLNTYVQTAKQQPNFGDEEVTIFITGLPQAESQTVAKANRKLVQAYNQRYHAQNNQQNQDNQQKKNGQNNQDNSASTSSDEDSNETRNAQQKPSGNLVIIHLGSALDSFKRFAMLDTEKTGQMIGKSLVQLSQEANVPQEIMHIVAQGVASQVAGAAGRQFTRLTGNKLRRITALDPTKIYARNPKTVTGLARGDADFVDAIHTSTYGMGTPNRVGDVDFYPNGPSAGVPGATNVVEASMRATRYFAESVRPGNERNFPAVAANSLQQQKNNNGHGPRTYMGIDTDFDQRGDFILDVNAKSPFGQRNPAQRQTTYHGNHQAWRNAGANGQDYE